MFSAIVTIIVILGLAFWWKLRFGKVNSDPPSKLKELKPWQKI